MASLPLSGAMWKNRSRTSSLDEEAGIGRSMEGGPTFRRLSQGSSDGALFMSHLAPWMNEKTSTATGRRLPGARGSCSPKTRQCVLLPLLVGR